MKHHLFKIKKILTKADLFLIVFLIIISVILTLNLTERSQNAEVYIYQHNKLIKQVKLTEKQQQVSIAEGIVLEIMDFRIRLLESTCRNQLCVKQGWTSQLPIVCVPNELLIIIKSSSSEEKLLITS